MLIEETLKKVMTGLIDYANKERRESKPYKDLFKSADSIEGLLRDAEMKMISVVLDAYQAYEDKYHRKNDALWDTLLALPYLTHKLEKDILTKA